MRDTKDKKDCPISPQAIKAMHSINRPEVLQKLFILNRQQLIRNIITEIDAKNEAYYFILENGHFDAFCSYCKSQTNDALSNNVQNLNWKLTIKNQQL